jgi:circadian clock protein KaiC
MTHDRHSQKLLSNDKKRGRAHERTIRELALESGGIRVGQPLRDFRGVLTGVPILEAHTNPLREGKPS